MTIKARFEKFTKQIKPTDEHIEEANRQTGYMIDRLKNLVSNSEKFTLEKVLKAGSNAKFTSLRKTEENIFDVDLGVYYSGQGATKEHLSSLLKFTHDQVRNIYGKIKQDEDFEILKSAVRVKFRSGIKLNVDVTPIIRDDSLGLENGGWIPRNDEWRLTSVTCHNQFVHKRIKLSDSVNGPVKFNRLIRMVKWWNNLQGKLKQPSIFCDLITAAAFERCGVTDEWQTSLRQVFTFLRKHQFLQPIIFNDYYDPKIVSLKDSVIIMDSVNPKNNIARDWTETTRQGYLDLVQEAYDAMMDAKSYELEGEEDSAVEAWCRVFGDAFRTLSEPSEEES